MRTESRVTDGETSLMERDGQKKSHFDRAPQSVSEEGNLFLAFRLGGRRVSEQVIISHFRPEGT